MVDYRDARDAGPVPPTRDPRTIQTELAPRPGISRWIWAALAVVVVLFLLAWLFGGTATDPAVTDTATPPAIEAPATEPAPAN